MTELPLHPVAVHLPIALAILMPFVVGGFLLAWFRGVVPRRAFVVVVGLQALLVVSGVVGIRTGELEEEKVEHVVPHEAVEHHEHDAKRFVASSFLVLVLVLVAHLAKNERVARGLAVASAIAAVGSTFLALDAGHHGGELVYEHGAADAYRESPR